MVIWCRSGPRLALSLVVLADVAEGFFEYVVVADFELDVEDFTECLADFLVTLVGVLPAVEADGANYLVDAVDDVFHDDGGAVALQGFEELGEGGLALFLARLFANLLFSGDGVAGELKQVAEEVEAGLLAVHQVAEHVDIEDDRLQVVARELDHDVLVDQIDGLGSQGVPDEAAGDVDGADRLIYIAQSVVVGLVLREQRVGADRFP
jgi:hypothetical protein